MIASGPSIDLQVGLGTVGSYTSAEQGHDVNRLLLYDVVQEIQQ